MTPERCGIELPKDPDTRLWRYMDFAKFVSMLDRRALWFARSDCLGDSFEFSYPKANHDAFRGTPMEANNHFFLWAVEAFAKTMFVSCWYACQHESTAMWSQYLNGQQGVTIQTTYARLREALAGAPESRELEFGLVNYVDYETQRINDQWLYSFIFHKRIQFASEREFRAVYWEREFDREYLVGDMATVHLPDTPPPGHALAVNLGGLIETITVAPTSPPWFAELVGSVARKYDLDVPVVRSSLAATPLR